MKKAVITILGIQNAKWNNDKPFIVDEKHYSHQAKYYFENDEKKIEYYNTLPLLIENFSDEYKIVPIYTEDAKIFNQDVLKYANKEVDFDDEISLIKDDKDYNAIFTQVDNIIKKYDKVIIDVTHGFRHLPLLMLIDLMMINFNDNEKIEKILFAKEIEKHTPNQKGEYEIIDLKDYMDLANLNYVLTSFERNYTTAKIKTSNEEYNKFLDLLEEFSEHILANSLDALIKDTKTKKSISYEIIKQIDELTKKDDYLLSQFKQTLSELKLHIEEIKNYQKEVDYKKLYLFSNNMKNKGYFLNSITLLSEAVGLYCKELLKDIDNEVKSFIEGFENKVNTNKENSRFFTLYILSNNSKNIYKLGDLFKGGYLFLNSKSEKYKSHNKKANKIADKIKAYIESIKEKEDYKKLQNLINEVDILRNNLAHGNSSLRLNEVENVIENLLKKFEELNINKTQKKEIKKETKPKPKKTKPEYKPSGLGNSFRFKGFK